MSEDQTASTQPVATAPVEETKPLENPTEVAGAEAKPENQAQPEVKKEEAPQVYELKNPEGYEVSDDYKKGLAAYAKENGLTPEQAQKVLDREASLLGRAQARQEEEFRKLSEETWVDSLRQDPVVGGNNFAQNMEVANRALQRFASPEFIKELEETRYGNHPGLVKFMVNIGKAMANDSFVQGKSSSLSSRPIEERMFPSMVKK